jgi:hypothetical protein
MAQNTRNAGRQGQRRGQFADFFPDGIAELMQGFRLTPSSAQDEKQQGIAQHWISYYETRFAASQNPVFAWDAIGECLSAGISLPPWVSEYLINVSREFHSLSRSRVPKKGDVARAVAKATGFIRGKGALNLFREAGQPAHELMIAMNVYEGGHSRASPRPDQISKNRRHFEITTTYRHPDRCLTLRVWHHAGPLHNIRTRG